MPRPTRHRLVLLATVAGLAAVAVRRACRPGCGCAPGADRADAAEAPSGIELADRVRTALGPIERELDLPRVHVFADRHVVVLHGEVPSAEVAHDLELAAGVVEGVLGVESHLHVGLLPSDTRPSVTAERPSEAYRRLHDAALRHGAGERGARLAVKAVLGHFAGALPTGTRARVASHLPPDVAVLFTPPRRIGTLRPMTMADLLDGIVHDDVFPPDRAPWVVDAVLHALHGLVPADADAIARLLPEELRLLWDDAALVEQRDAG